MRDAILHARLRSRQLVVALEPHGSPRNSEDRIGAPLAWIRRTTLRLHSAAPLIGEKDLAAVVVESRGMPVREIRVRRRAEANGMRGITDVEQQSVATARAACSANRRVK